VKKRIFQILAIGAILIILVSPFLLIINAKKYSAFVALVTISSIVYFIFIKEKKK